MGKTPSDQFYYGDWERDMGEHPHEMGGAWMLILSRLWFSENRGQASKNLNQWSKILRVSTEEALKILQYLKNKKIATIPIDLTQPNGQITIISRRQVKDEKSRKSNRLRQQRHYQKQTHSQPNGQPNKNLTPPSSSSTSYIKNIKSKKLFVGTSNEVRLSNLLFSLILDQDPKYPKPNIQTWALHIDKLIRIDKRDPFEIEKIIRWCQIDNFWHSNILSTAKLREKYPQLKSKMETANGNDRQGTTTGKQALTRKTQGPAPYSDGQPYPVDDIITPDDPED